MKQTGMKEIELLPCPFCGGPGRVATNTRTYYGSKGQYQECDYFAECEVCDFQLGHPHNWDQWGDVVCEYSTPEAAAVVWNKRTISPPSTQEEPKEVISSEPTQEELWNAASIPPDHDGLVIMGHIDDKWVCAGWHDKETDQWYNQYENPIEDAECYPSHWQPLPQLPKNFEIKRKG